MKKWLITYNKNFKGKIGEITLTNPYEGTIANWYEKAMSSLGGDETIALINAQEISEEEFLQLRQYHQPF